MNKKLLLALLIPVVIAGCLATGTIVFDYQLDDFGAIGSGMQTRYVNLATNSDYDDNKDKIKSVDAIVLVGEVYNLGSDSVYMNIYLSDDSLATEAEVLDEATQIFVSPKIAGGDTLRLHWQDGMDYMRNMNVLVDQLKGDGQFYLYGIPSGNILVRYTLDIIVTITVGL